MADDKVYHQQWDREFKPILHEVPHSVSFFLQELIFHQQEMLKLDGSSLSWFSGKKHTWDTSKDKFARCQGMNVKANYRNESRTL